MSCIDCPPEMQTLGSNPAMINWRVVRGDTAKLRVSFLEKNEVDQYNTTGWQYSSTAYDPKNDISYELTVVQVDEFVDIIAPAELTETWGANQNTAIVAELSFDLQVNFSVEDEIWTPIIGNITVIGDVTGGSI
jgi:hypothetical protein